MRYKTIQEQYNRLTEGKVSKIVFLKQAKRQFPNMIRNAAGINEAVKILKNRGVIKESMYGIKEIQPLSSFEPREEESWEKAFKSFLNESFKFDDTRDKGVVDNTLVLHYGVQAGTKVWANSFPVITKGDLAVSGGDWNYKELLSVKGVGYNEDGDPVAFVTVLDPDKKEVTNATWAHPEELKKVDPRDYIFENKISSKKVSKDVTDIQSHAYRNSDTKNLDNQISSEVFNGIYFEMKKTPEKTLNEIRKIVSKNLSKDPLYYKKNAAFGIDGIGYETLKQEQVVGKHAYSGYGTRLKKLVQESLLFEGKSKKRNIDDELKEIENESEILSLETKINRLSELIKMKEDRISLVAEDEDLSELVDSKKIKVMQKEISDLNKKKDKCEKLYEKITGSSYGGEIIDETPEISEEDQVREEVMSEFGYNETDLQDESINDRVSRTVNSRLK